jgi:EpsD family peptidyl-prolyl cis-trans isomerase
MNIRNSLVFTALLLAAILATGCEKKESTRTATQVAARVNADEITVHQVNNVLAQRGDITPEAGAQAKRAILDTLINQQLARQKAIETQLDRSPKVMQAIEAAKTEILARAHLDGIARTLPKPDPRDIKNYYEKHPELFAQRRIFSLEEIAFIAGGDVVAGLREQLSRSRSMKQTADWLQSRGIKFAVSRGVRAAEQIPLEMLPKVHVMKEGELRLFEAADGRFQVIRVVDSMAAPVDEATAAPRIHQFLFNRSSGQAIAREMNEIRGRASVEYLGEFARSGTAAESKGKTEAEAKSITGDQDKKAVEAKIRTEDLSKERSRK